MRLKACAPARLRKQPETFCWTDDSCANPVRPDCCQNPRADLPESKRRLAGGCAGRASRFLAALCGLRPFFPGGAVALGVRRSPSSSTREIRRFPGDDFEGMEPALAFGSCFFGRGLHVQEQLFEIGSPKGVLFFGQKHQLPQEMHNAEGMFAPIQEIRPPAIMDGDPVECGQNPDRFQRLVTSARIDMIVREALGAGGMHPRALALHIQPRFILMDDLGHDQGSFDVLLDIRQIARTAAGSGCRWYLRSSGRLTDLP
jgi:hypothetical protein